MTIEDLILEIPCPNCKAMRCETIGWFKANPNYTCTSCSGNVIIDLDDLEAELSEAANELDNVAGMADPKN